MLNRRSELLSNSKAFYFSDLMEFEEFYLRFLINKTFNIVGSVLKFEIESKYFIKYFFGINAILKRNLLEASKYIRGIYPCLISSQVILN